MMILKMKIISNWISKELDIQSLEINLIRYLIHRPTNLSFMQAVSEL